MTGRTMRVLVILASDTAIEPAAGERAALDFDRGSEQRALDVAMALCMRLKCPLTALSLGASKGHVQSLRAAIARGCSRAVALTWNDETGEDSDEQVKVRAETPPHGLDYLAIAEVLRAAVVYLGTSVVVCPDDSRARIPNRIVGPAVAELMGASHLTSVMDVRPRSENGSLGLWVEQRSGSVRFRFYAEAPVVLTVDGCGPVSDRRPPALDGDGESVDLEFLAISDLGIDNELLERGKLVTGSAREPTTTMVESAENLLERLFEDQLLL